MPSVACRALILGLGLLPLVVVSSAWAQRRDGRETLRLSGTVQGIRPPYLQVTSNENVQWILQVQAQPQDIFFKGTAEPTWMRPGLLVRFTANFNSRGQSDQPLRELTVYTPRQGAKSAGVYPDSVLDTEGLFSEEEKTVDNPAERFTPFLVLGRYMGVKNGKLQVAAGRTPVQIELAEKVEISVDLADYTFARPGDKIEAEGWYLTGQPGKAIVSELRITAEKPLAGVTRGRGRRSADEEPMEGDKSANPPGPVPADPAQRAGPQP